MIKLVLDCFGGDLSPDVNIIGAVDSLNKLPNLTLILTGDKDIISQKLEGLIYDPERLIIEHAPEVVTCHEKPTEAIRRKDTSLYRAFELARENDDISGLISLGSTGAVLSGAVLRFGRIKGVLRPAFCPIMPTMNGGVVGICDSGANAECTPEYLQQFAIMGSRYIESVYGVQKARVALLNMGVEAEKGDPLHIAAHKLLVDTPSINFVGNMESRDVLSGKYDLVVCDGFSGNVLIKATEGACLEMLKMLKREMTKSLKNKFGALFLKKSIMQQKEFMDYRNYSGGVMLGTRKIVVKCHGDGTAVTVRKCIEQAYMMASKNLNETIERELQKITSE